jgi:hypothetical protein
MRGRWWIRGEKEDKRREGLEKGEVFWLSKFFTSCEGEKIYENGRRREEAVWDYVSILHLLVLTADLRTLTEGGGGMCCWEVWARGSGNCKESWG